MTVPAEFLPPSTPADAEAAGSIRRHHAELAGGLAARVEALIAAVEGPDADHVQTARADLVTFCRHELVPHARAEESSIYPAAATLPQLTLLVGVMVSEHVEIQMLVDEIATSSTGVRVAAAARALAAIFRPHLTAENDVLVTHLAADQRMSLADLLQVMHHDLVAHQADPR